MRSPAWLKPSLRLMVPRRAILLALLELIERYLLTLLLLLGQLEHLVLATELHLLG